MLLCQNTVLTVVSLLIQFEKNLSEVALTKYGSAKIVRRSGDTRKRQFSIRTSILAKPENRFHGADQILICTGTNLVANTL